MTEPLTAKACYGVVHMPPLPGTPFYRPDSFEQSLRAVADSAMVLEQGGLQGVLLQTFDRVYSVADDSDPARVAAMALCVREVVRAAGPGFRIGVQIMRHAVSASLAVAKVCGAAFVRADAIVGATLSTHGHVEPDPLSIMTYRRRLDAFDVELIADVDSMHYTWNGPAETTAGVAKRALLVGADAVCIADPDADRTLRKIADVRRASPGTRVVLGGHLNHDNVTTLMAAADAAFVSGCLADPDRPDEFDPDRVRRFADLAAETR